MRKLYLLFIFCASIVASFGQGKAEKALALLNEKYPQEKVHLFFNKEGFVAGETVCLKSYIFSGNVLSHISTNLYLEVYNDQKQLIDKQILPVIGGVGQGSFTFGEKTPEGIYHVRAYTKWMLNFGEEFQYFTSLPVYNLSSGNRLAKKPVEWTATAYPESGILISGQENKLAIKLTAIGSLPASFSGMVVDKSQSGKSILGFKSLNPQFASFYFTPEQGKEYEIRISDDQGKTSTISMPPATGKGVALRAEQSGDQVYLDLVFQGLPEGGLNHKILAHVQNEVVFSAFIRKKDELVKASFPVGKLGNGVMHLTIFDENEVPVAERLLFIENNQSPQILVRVDSLSPDAREKVVLKVAIDTFQYNTYALSVADAALSAPRKRTIASDLWLGDLSSNISNPAWYFSTDDHNRKLALDALMISEKWTRFDWKKIISQGPGVISFPPDKYLSFFATATRFRKVVQNETLNLLVRYKDSSVQLTQVKTDNLGSFQIENAAFYDTVKVYFQSNQKKGSAKDVDIVFESGNFFKGYSGSFPQTEFILVKRKPGDDIPPMVKNALDAMKVQEAIDDRYQDMEGVVVEAKRKTETQKLNEKLASSLFTSDNEYVFDFVNEDQGAGAYSNILQFLEGRVPGLHFSMREDGVLVPTMRGEQVGVFIDEIYTDYEMVGTVPISQIAMVKVLRGYFLGGMTGTSAGGNGAIAIYTNRGGLGGRFAPSGMPSAYLVGYKEASPFRTFDYENEMYRSAKSDTRDNLYWNANLLPDKQGLVPVKFFNNDVSRSYKLIISGFTKDAMPVYEEKIITIRQ